jgi:hypothetical protein
MKLKAYPVVDLYKLIDRFNPNRFAPLVLTKAETGKRIPLPRRSLFGRRTQKWPAEIVPVMPLVYLWKNNLKLCRLVYASVPKQKATKWLRRRADVEASPCVKYEYNDQTPEIGIIPVRRMDKKCNAQPNSTTISKHVMNFPYPLNRF